MKAFHGMVCESPLSKTRSKKYSGDKPKDKLFKR